MKRRLVSVATVVAVMTAMVAASAGTALADDSVVDWGGGWTCSEEGEYTGCR